MLNAGDKAPLFKATSTKGELNLATLVQQRPTVIYFFPKAFTPG